MWLASEDNLLCINLAWIETFSLQLKENASSGVINFPWGNESLFIQDNLLVFEIRKQLCSLSIPKNHIRTFHAFSHIGNQILIDLSEIKVIKLISNELIFYRRYFNARNHFVEAEADGEISKADGSEWKNLCAEINFRSFRN